MPSIMEFAYYTGVKQAFLIILCIAVNAARFKTPFHTPRARRVKEGSSRGFRIALVKVGMVARVKAKVMDSRIYVIAQPILFHYYTTDNLPREHHCGTQACAGEVPREKDMLPGFLRSVISRPNLAFQVKTDEISGCTPDLAQLLSKTTESLGAAENAPTQEYLQTKIWQGFSGQPRTLMRIQRRIIHHWLEELAVLLSPNIERLFIARDSFVHHEHIEDSGTSFPALKTITIKGVSKNQHVHEASALFKAAPNLESLSSLQCSLFGGISPWVMARQ
ncbi:hypothetical protein LY76DRAFT_639347 [Colletotrichum caudatum]|nr:hypothetical protein LY76DRAFT_639347 [Colletotrichum caudatum]